MIQRLFFLILLCIYLPAAHANETITFDKPPPSLKQWYKPQSKRNVWHHNMFKLRREIQAVNEYMTANDTEHTQKWALRLVTHYRKIAEMVPEWKDELELAWADKLEAAAKQGELAAIGKAVKKLKQSCSSCHKHYRAQVATLYRAPDFSQVHVSLAGQQITYLDFMKQLMADVNRIKIAAEDGYKDKAQTALKALRGSIKTLGSSCSTCHKDAEARAYYLGDKTEKLLNDLEQDINSGKSGHTLGRLAVQACARCHGSHRIVYDLKTALD
ncbi:cytochrome c [Candidatus Venteria ishoeyi]|uniref:cytochrome c n=1 Tax=Candidatus Venteria ishoeyi TaxID=1899563 RepID=UPI0025A5A056|nr:cytochrome c [Candidatus Venteria ishoeyi]MDM8545216.1 cytochrome c [Candidatus Venteria ishoeyi]